jgi:hypothetical protein
VLVREPKEAALRDPNVPPDCTTSRTAPLVDLGIGGAFAGFVFGATYAAINELNEECTGNCYTPWKPALLAAFLVVSPWWISSAVGFSDTSRCRKLYTARGVSY